MESLVGKFYKKLDATDVSFVRDTMHKVNWEARLVGIKGARGIGKTSLLIYDFPYRYITAFTASVTRCTLGSQASTKVAAYGSGVSLVVTRFMGASR